jgi:hypothetical protein
MKKELEPSPYIKGQVIVFIVLSLIPLTLFWITIINIGQLVKDRIILQNAADCAAQTIACIRARALNIIGAENAALGVLLTIPEFCFWPQTDCNSGFHWGTCDALAKTYEQTVRGIIISQEGINSAYGGGWSYLEAGKTAKNVGADGLYPFDAMTDKFSLKLERNKGDIWYWKSFNCGATVYGHYHLGPLPDPMTITKRTDTNRWYQQSKDFYKKKMRIVAYKKYGKKSWFPLAHKLLGINRPEIMAIAASRPYNKNGPMFPVKTEYWVNIKLKTKEIEVFGKKIGGVPDGAGVDFGGKGGLCATEAWNDGIGGLSALAEGKPGGWDAQLVPVGQPFQH